MLNRLRLTLEPTATKRASSVLDGAQPCVLPAGERPRPRNRCLLVAVPLRVAALWYHGNGLVVKPDPGLKPDRAARDGRFLPSVNAWVSTPKGASQRTGPPG